jgi:lipopolysaccharide transport system permease protein
MLLALLLAFALSLWTSVWQARARDMRFVLMYVIGFWALLTPVVYPASQLPANVRWLAAMNPMTGPVEAFKWSVLGLGPWPAYPLAVSVGMTVVILLGGMWYFGRAEGEIADRL